MKIIRIFLFPISLLYGSIVFMRNKLFDWNILTSTTFNLPIISVGNLSVGGTGKTPQIEYLIRLLKQDFYIATLSRGYGRKTKGFILADTQSTSTDIGDEPLQLKQKYTSVKVAVDEKRVHGVESLLKHFPSIQTILLDDAFQHRYIKPGLSILLTDFSQLYSDDFILPTGDLREFSSGSERADIIIVTKCPNLPLPIERENLINQLSPKSSQKIYFSTIGYGDFLPFNKKQNSPFNKAYYFENNYSILLLSGIASIEPLIHYLKENTNNLETLSFPDHHQFVEDDIKKLTVEFKNITSAKKIILTTEKDVMRLRSPKLSSLLNQLPIFYIPIEATFNKEDTEAFNAQIINYVRSNQKHS